MRIGIDAREAAHPDSGTGTYVAQLLRALLQADRASRYVLFAKAGEAGQLPSAPNAEVRELPRSRIDKFQDQWSMARAAEESRLDILHVTHHDVTPLLCRVPIVATVLDLAWLDVPGSSSRSFQRYYRWMTRAALRKARGVVTISESTLERVAYHFPEVAARTRAIPIACDPAYRLPAQPAVLDRLAGEFGLRSPYVLYAGSFAARKNLGLLLTAWEKVAAAAPGVSLVLAGRPSGRDDTPLEQARHGGVVIAGRRKTLQEMQALYAGAEMLVFPSRYEGFGLPVLEAMTSGCPVIASTATSLPEIVGDAGILVDPDDAPGLARQILGLLGDPARRALLREAGLTRARQFDWGRVAARTLEAYRDAAR